ncbi:MAG: hypothetical protein R6V12_08715, partial [Candidatus Hydrogenedentota bacterium]
MPEKDTQTPSAGSFPQPVNLAAWTVFAIALFWILWIGKALIIPFFLAILAFYLVNILNDFWRKTIFRWTNPPNLLVNALSATVFI